MKQNNEEIDKMIREALSQEEAKFYDQLGEQSLPEMVGGLFAGKMKWLTVLTVVIQFFWLAAAVYCGYQFFEATDLREMMIWGAGGFLFTMSMSMLKLFHWMQMDKNALMREIKRMELQIATLSAKVGGKK